MKVELITDEPDAPDVAPPDGRSGVSALLIAAALAGVIALLVAGQRPESSTAPSSTPTSINPPAVDDGDAGIVTWPAPPEDHDPHVSIRPGSGEPVRPDLADSALVYINDIGRPTVIDLATGLQQELTVAQTRVVDSFIVEGGAVVSPDPSSNLPPAGTRGIRFEVHRSADQPTPAEPGFGSGPRLCLAADGCPRLAWTTGFFGDEDFFVQSVDVVGEPSRALATELRASSWLVDGRWTTFDVRPPGSPLRVPSPAFHATIWLITDRPTTVEG